MVALAAVGEGRRPYFMLKRRPGRGVGARYGNFFPPSAAHCCFPFRRTSPPAPPCMHRVGLLLNRRPLRQN